MTVCVGYAQHFTCLQNNLIQLHFCMQQHAIKYNFVIMASTSGSPLVLWALHSPLYCYYISILWYSWTSLMQHFFSAASQRFLNICQSTGRAILYSNWRVMSDTGFHTGQCSLFLTDYSTGAGQKPKCWVHGKLYHPLDDWWEAERFFFPFLFYLCKVETDSWPSKTQLKHS